MQEECSSKKGCGCGCSCGCNNCSCSSSCGSSCGSGKEEENFFIELADEAWTEVLKEKMKEHLLSTQGDRMAELAKIVAEGNNHRWKLKMEKKQACSDFKEKLCRFFSHSKK